MYYLKINPNHKPLAALNSQLPHIIWGHGWGKNHSSLQPIANTIKDLGHHWLLDFPGFGNTPPPEAHWGTKEYSEYVLKWIRKNIPTNSQIIWVGHSFGGRIGLNLAATNPEIFDGLFLIAAAGIKVHKNIFTYIKKLIQVKIFKLFKFILTITCNKTTLNSLKNNFGSFDYRNATPTMRNILVKIINEDLADVAAKIKCKTSLVYGTKDQETPIIIGKKLQQLIKDSELHILPEQDHWSLLGNIGVTTYLLKNFINDINGKR